MWCFQCAGVSTAKLLLNFKSLQYLQNHKTMEIKVRIYILTNTINLYYNYNDYFSACN